MNYLTEFSMHAIGRLKQMDRLTASIVLAWVRKCIDGKDPRLHGSTMVGGIGWNYKIGTYRLLAEIRDECKTVLLLWIGKPADE